MAFGDRLSSGWKLGLTSLGIIRKHRQLIIFPVISGFSLLVVMATFFFIIAGANNWHFNSIIDNTSPLYYIYIFITYLVNYFIIVFFNVALVHSARKAFKGETPSVSEGISYSMTRISTIFSWAIIAATVGLLLRVIAENLGRIGQIITAILGITWSITTFFVVPVLAYENTGPVEALKKSAAMMKAKWGESIGAGFSFFLLQLVCLIGIAIVAVIFYALFGTLAAVAIAILGILLMSVIFSAANMVFISAVYQQVTGDPVQDFENDAIDSLFIKKEKKGLFN